VTRRTASCLSAARTGRRDPYADGVIEVDSIIEEAHVSMRQRAPEGDGGTKGGVGGGVIALLAGLGLLGVFMAQNTDDVSVSFLAWDFTWPVWLLTFAAAVLGALIWFGAGVLRRHRRRKERRANRRD
jgi:uncharacterized integral membrane protein